ncbi:hypothetical protein EJ110_NYTH51089 [Nymphaea thermarum]|nr:hypothetical protein EJ110_NYTH51089 [Nymphaea thermarum]
MRDPISQSHALGLIVNNLTQPLRSLISNAPIKSFIDLTERAECIEAGIENGAFDVVIQVKVREDTKKNSRSQNASANIVANAAIFKKETSEYPKNKGVMDRASGSSSGTKNKHPGRGHDRKFTPLQQSYEEVMHMLIERGTLFLPKVSNPPPMMGKNKEQFCKFHRAPRHDTEDCLILKNIVQDAVDKEIIKVVSEQPDILKNPFPKHGKGTVSMVRFSTSHPIMVTNKRDTTSLDFFGLLLKHDKGSINAQTELVKQDSLTEIDQKSQVWDPEPLGSIFKELAPLPEIKKGGFNPNRGNEWAFELCENGPITFSDKDLPIGGASHNDVLHIVVETKGTRVSHVLIDGGASLNICPQQTARELGMPTIPRHQFSSMDTTEQDNHASDRIRIFGDSLLAVSQVNVDWQVKEQKLISYQELAASLLRQFEEYQLLHVKREFNPIADDLASLGSTIAFKPGESIRSFEVGKLEQPSFVIPEQVLQAESRETPWYQNIKDFLQTGTLPPEMSRKEQRVLRHMSSRYFILADILYRRGFSTEYARCLNANEALEVVQEALEGICGGHVGYQTLVKQIVRAGYYWPTMQRDYH